VLRLGNDLGPEGDRIYSPSLEPLKELVQHRIHYFGNRRHIDDAVRDLRLSSRLRVYGRVCARRRPGYG